jgi:uncharacterized membrane protein YcaP (DUF421 family)
MSPHWFWPEISVVEKILRPILVYAFLVTCLRLSGKRVLSQLNPFDLVLLLILSNTVQNAIIGKDDSIGGGAIGVITLMALNAALVWVRYNSKLVERVLVGEPEILIENGHPKKAVMRAERIEREELQAAAHRQGFEHFNEIKKAAIEPGGAIWFERVTPTAGEKRHQELLERLDRIEQRLSQ